MAFVLYRFGHTQPCPRQIEGLVLKEWSIWRAWVQPCEQSLTNALVAHMIRSLVNRSCKSYTRCYVQLYKQSIVHYSMVKPLKNRVVDLKENAIEIGPCWTSPSFRRTGLLKNTLGVITSSIGGVDAFVMIIREENRASVAAAVKSGFFPASRLVRHKGCSGLNRYIMMGQATESQQRQNRD